MASEYFGINRGVSTTNPGNFTVGASTGSTDFEFRVDTGKGSTKLDAVLALQGIIDFILTGPVQNEVYPAQ